jgi:hypothetical protein
MGVANSFHSVLSANLPSSGVVGDIWFATDTKLIYAVVGDGSLHELLTSTPLPVAGPQGVQGIQGLPGNLILNGSAGFFGTWTPSPTQFQVGAIVSWEGFLYISKAAINISDNSMSPNGNPFWQVLGPTSTTRTSALVCFIDGQGVPLSAPSNHGVASFPFTGTISGWTLTSDVPGSAVLDILACSYAAFPGGLASICGSNKPTLASQQKNEALDVSSLFTQTAFNQGDQLQFVLDSASSVTQLTLTLILSASN